MPDGLTVEQQRSYDNGLRIFARWIARAYIKERNERKSAANNALSDTARGEKDQVKDNGHLF